MSPSIAGSSIRSVSRERLADQTADALREYVIANRLKPGTRLPAETVLADALGVSRNVLRQAMAALQNLGMLRVEQGSGTYVADVADTDVFRQIAAWMASEPLTEKDYLEVRSIWERGIFEHVMEHATDDELDRMAEIAERLVPLDEGPETNAIHEEFHQELHRATGNPFLLTMGTILHRFFWEFGYREAIVRKPPRTRLQHSHLEIVQLLKTRDKENIRRMVDLHLAPHLDDDDPGEHG
jgi:GntR family transcriptional regulator, transcriptional repressor for pyruvate dehydrogenase complex